MNQTVNDYFLKTTHERGTMFIKRSYTVFVVNRAYIVLVCHPHSTYHTKHNYYGEFDKYTTLVLGHCKFATDKPL